MYESRASSFGLVEIYVGVASESTRVPENYNIIKCKHNLVKYLHYLFTIINYFCIWNIGGSTKVAFHAWNNARKCIWGLPPPVKLERHHMTCTVSVWHKTQLNKQTNYCIHIRFLVKIQSFSSEEISKVCVPTHCLHQLPCVRSNIRMVFTAFVHFHFSWPWCV
jgi:hypothetical protein